MNDTPEEPDAPELSPEEAAAREAARRAKLAPAARRALEEADLRRARGYGDEGARPREKGGQAGAEPTRYGDWEKKGRISDF